MVEYLYVFLLPQSALKMNMYGLPLFFCGWISCGRAYAYARTSIAAQKTHDDSLLICVH